MPKIEIRSLNVSEKKDLLNFERSYLTSYVWQMERQIEEGKTTITFHQIRLPREIRVEIPYSLEKIKEVMERAAVLVAVLNGIPVGFIALEERESPGSAWISYLVVSEPHRRQGIASGLTIAAHEWATQRDLRRIIIEVQSKNYPAIQLALKLGYEFYGYHDQFYANHDIALFFSRFLR